MNRNLGWVVWLLAGSLCAEELALRKNDVELRLGRVRQLARERNDPRLVREVEATTRGWAQALPSDVEARLRQLETAVGIDPGGATMAGQPLFRPEPGMDSALHELTPKLAAAMAAEDVEAVRAITRRTAEILGQQAGVPDGRRPGLRAELPLPSRAEAVRVFLEALATEGRALKTLLQGELLPGQMLRFYGYLLEACVTMHPQVAALAPERLAELERLLRATAGLLVRLQQPEGHFPFPDLRGRNLRFGEMTEKQLAAGVIEIRDGWIVTPDPDGGSQFDTGVCGVALLRAAELLGDEAWRQAALRAARWAAAQPCCTNFNYNAFSVSLLARAGFREQALAKFRIGLAPGQAANGRWLDPHNARTVYHVILLRGLADLGRSEEVDAVAQPAIRALLDEFDAMGITVEALPELRQLAERFPEDTRLHKAVRDMASVIFAKCSDGERVKMGAQPHQLAAVVGICD